MSLLETGELEMSKDKLLSSHPLHLILLMNTEPEYKCITCMKETVPLCFCFFRHHLIYRRVTVISNRRGLSGTIHPAELLPFHSFMVRKRLNLMNSLLVSLIHRSDLTGPLS